MEKSSQKVFEKYSCNFCHYTTSKKTNYDKHLFTRKHKEIVQNGKKVADKYYCMYCDYKTSKKTNYDKHLTTRKHFEIQKIQVDSRNKNYVPRKCISHQYQYDLLEKKIKT